ncbi:MAG TPA: hypothetical protein VFX06_15550 [Stellaceae bacterium]|nr:hypothetical protein [Stellaceae bacterium]
MRAIVVGAAALGLVAALAGCVQPYAPPQLEFAMARVDPEDAADRALIGSVVGAALGTGLGTTLAINPAIGAVIGVESGAAIGAAIGAVTAQPIPDYAPIPASAALAIPQYYDSWPPGYDSPPIGTQAPPPPLD